MTGWNQGPQHEGFDVEQQRLLELTKAQINLAAGYESSFLSYPELAEFSGQTAATLTEGALSNMGHSDSYPDHPAVAQIQAVYKRLVFSFTNPANFTDRASDNAMLNFFDDTMSESTVKYAGLQVIANRFDMASTTILMCFLALDAQDVLVGVVPSECFQFVRGYYKALLKQGGADGEIPST